MARFAHWQKTPDLADGYVLDEAITGGYPRSSRKALEKAGIETCGNL